ncbi:ABC transporter substrate-binding protein [Nocardia sp. NPDC049220]|uniref:ABC transporter substrate-binding protein n=1 Tax=Nocardia sp. NPDC049220 TaxID=3155273 RepID=UPI0033D41C96
MKAVRVALVTALAGALALGSTGCALPTRESRAHTEPVTVNHAFGTTTITGTPHRVIALGDRWLDSIAALRVTPIGRLMPRPDEPSPWASDSVGSATSLDPTGNLVGQIAALHPDLILLDEVSADRKTYDELAGVAPTMPADQRADASWRDRISTLGKLLRRVEEADQFVADVDAKIATAAAANPRLTGKTYAAAWLAGDEQLIVHTQPSTACGELFTRLGLRVPDTLAALPATRGHVVLPPERIDELGADVLLAGYSPGFDEKYRLLSGYADLPATKTGAVVFLTTTEFAALEQPTALSIRYLLDKLAPVLSRVR